MYDWLTAAPQYYEKYTYDTNKLTKHSSFKTLPPKPVTNRVNRLSQNLGQKQYLSNTRRSSYQIEDTYPKYVYQTKDQSLSFSKTKYIHPYSSSNVITPSKDFVLNEPHYITIASNQEDEEVDEDQNDDENDETNDTKEYYQYNIASYSDQNAHFNTKHSPNRNENVVYLINNQDDYGNNLNMKTFNRFSRVVSLVLPLIPANLIIFVVVRD